MSRPLFLEDETRPHHAVPPHRHVEAHKSTAGHVHRRNAQYLPRSPPRADIEACRCGLHAVEAVRGGAHILARLTEECVAGGADWL